MPADLAEQPSHPGSLVEKGLFVVGRFVVRGVVHLLRWSCAMEVSGFEHAEAALATGRPLVFVFWHGAIVPILLLRYHIQLPLLATMISRSRDGEIAAELAGAFGTTAVRASSSRGGAVGLLQFRDYLLAQDPRGIPRVGFHVVDGPRGPRQKVKPGILLLARQTNALILPISIGIARRWVARSWDRHRVPLPFGRCVYIIGEPIDVGKADERGADFTTEDLEAAFARLAASHPLCARDAALP